MATTQVIDLLLQDGSDYESAVGIVGILYATVAAHAGFAYKRTPKQKTRARRLTGSLCAAATIRALGFAAFAILTHAPGTRSRLVAKGVVVLLCVPDFIVVSSYALLVVVWFEAFLDARCDLGVPRCCGAFTPSTRLVAIARCREWFLFLFRVHSDRGE